MTKAIEDTVTYSILGDNRIVQEFRSEYHPNVRTVQTGIPIAICSTLNDLCNQLIWHGDEKVSQRVIGEVFHAYFDIKTAIVTPLD